MQIADHLHLEDLGKDGAKSGIESNSSERRGWLCVIPTAKGSISVQKLRDQSFQLAGPRLFNCLPKTVRNMTKVSVDELKEKLDNFLACLPDHPKIGNLVPNICDQATARPSNSLTDVVKNKSIQYGGG